MKSALVTLLLILATATQPLLAIPAACGMAGDETMSCASCCAVNPCCTASERQQSAPLGAVVKAAGDSLAAIIPLLVAVPRPFVQPVKFPQFTRASGEAHAPPPLALNCIQLI